MTELMKQFPFVVSDSEWKGFNGGRCITDFYRTIETNTTITDTDMEQLKKWLEENNCPGWTGVKYLQGISNKELNKYKFSTCWDSSD